MRFRHEIKHLINGIILLFGLVAMGAAYWAAVGPDTLLLRQDNPRLVQAEARIKRGDIFDRNGDLLATSVENPPDGEQQRHYTYLEMASALGYSSIRYGVGGAEAAFNDILRGEVQPADPVSHMIDTLMHRPQVGTAIRLTFDANLQRRAVAELSGHRGSIVVLAVPSGQVLSMISLPSYDPNTLDQNWDSLATAPGNPFFNRALQGVYQPGSALQTPLLAAALLTGYPIDTPISYATQPIQLDTLSIPCVETPTLETLTLSEAYTYGCPYPFSEMIQSIGKEAIQASFDAFRLNQPVELEGYIQNKSTEAPPRPENAITAAKFTENALGQGTITVSPLEMAVIASAILNDGNAPSPYTLIQTRSPQSNQWVDDQTIHSTIPVLTANSARGLQAIMEETVKSGAARAAMQSNIPIGGHAAIAYVGKTEQVWFVGYIRSGNNSGAAIAVVLENTHDAALASGIGGRILASAYQYQN